MPSTLIPLGRDSTTGQVKSWATGDTLLGAGGAILQTDKYYVDGVLGVDLTADGTIGSPFKTIQACLNYIGQPTSHIDAMKHISIYLSDTLSATAGFSPQTFNGCYEENLTVPSRMITIYGAGVKIGSAGVTTGVGNILKEYSTSRRFGATSSELRPCLTLVGVTETRDSHSRLRNGIHVGGTCRTAILKRNVDSVQGDGLNKITVHITAGQFTYPITVTANYPTEPYIRINVNGTTSYNGNYDITAQIGPTTFEATRVSGTNAAVTVESGAFFESDSAGASGITHDSAFYNCYMQGQYTCDDGTVNSAAPTAGTEVMYAEGSRFFTGVQGRTILWQRWLNNTIANSVSVTAGSFIVGQKYTITAVGSTDFTLIGAASNTVGVRFVATGVGSGTGTASTDTIISSIAGLNNCSMSGQLEVSTFTYGTDDMGFMNNRFNSAVLFTVSSAAQTVRMDDTTYAGFLASGSSWITNQPTVSLLGQTRPMVLATVTGINLKTIATTNLFTVPTGKTAVITEAVFRLSAATAITVAPIVGIGIAAGEVDIIGATTLTGLDAITKNFKIIPAGISVNGAATNVIKLGVTTGATATTMTGVLDLIGYLI